MLFDDNKVEDEKSAANYIYEIEIPVCLNLSHCYNKLEQPHYAIKYATQVLDKNLPFSDKTNPTLEKAYYRRGIAYLKIGDLIKAKQDILSCLDVGK